MNEFDATSYHSRWFEQNPYYDPDYCFLEILSVAEKVPDYDFDIVVLWKDVGTEELFVAWDTGCSCPTPFEDIKNMNDLTPIRSVKDFDIFRDDLSSGAPKKDIQGMRRIIMDHLR